MFLRKRAAVFIDAGYLNKVAKALDSQYPDLLALSDRLCSLSGGSRRFRTYYYDCMPYQSNPPSDDERGRYQKKDKFVAGLRKLPAFEIRLGRLQKLPDGTFRQKKVDILLSIDLTRLAAKSQIQRAIIVAGDSDFVPSVELAKNEGVYCHLFFGKGQTYTVSDELYSVCDDRTQLTTDIFSQLHPQH